MYKKIYKYICLLLILVLVLVSAVLVAVTYTTLKNAVSEGYILKISEEFNLISIFIGPFWIFVILAVLIYLIATLIADRLTLNITKTIENIDPFDREKTDSIYPELQPFINRIVSQNKEISRQIEKVKSQKVRLQTIIENMSEPLVIVDYEKNILTVNEATLKLYGKSVNEYYKKSFYTISRDSELTQMIDFALMGNSRELIKDINEKKYRIFINPVKEKDKISAVVIIWMNISHKAEAEQIRKEFSANVTHELKTPLTTIKGYAQLISNGIAKEKDIVEFAKKIEKESGRLVTLIDDVLKLSKLDESNINEEKETVSLMEIIEEVVSELSPKAVEKGVTLITEGNKEFVIANYRQVLELVYNICDNAIKYNKDNGTVVLKASKNCIEISDTGIGISEEYTERIFERFFRVDKSHSKKVDGTGLGLSIVKHLALLNNADIKVESEVGQGTTFKVLFKEQA